MELQSINPATEENIEDFELMTDSRIDERLDRSKQAHDDWSTTTFDERADYLRKTSDILEEKAESFGTLMAREMGKPVSEGVSEAEKCAWVCDYYADNAESFLEKDVRPSDADTSYVTYNPLGTVLAIMPWNFPFWQVFRFAAPTIMAGNTALLKHAPNVTKCALEIEKIFESAGLPDGVFQTLLMDTDQAADVIADDRVQAVTLTGSTRAGQAVASESGEVLKKTVLELGGSDPYLILDDADLESTVETCVTSRLINSGQSCIAAKRFVVVEEHRDEFTERMIDAMDSKTMGNPQDNPDLGPQAREDLRDELHDQVQRSIDAGASLGLGGTVPDREGFFYPPTVLTGVEPGTPAYEEELFGPVATIIGVADESEAIEVANDSDFGLGAAVFTEDRERGEQIAAGELEAGCCFVNSYVKSDPRLPFGGIKKSGYGRELSREGIREFTNTKTVCVY